MSKEREGSQDPIRRLTKREARELAPLYALGALSAGEIAELEELAAADEGLRRELRGLDATVSELIQATGAGTEEPPSSALRGRVLASIREPREARREGGGADGSPELPPGLFVLRATEGEWQPTGVEGVEFRELSSDPLAQVRTALYRMAPGTAYPPHRHGGVEECYVLEGDLRVGDCVLRAGDYQRAAAGSEHQVQSTEGGCLLLISESLADERL